MSLEAIGWVLRDAPGVPAQCLGVLIGLAEHADKRGRGAYPSAGTLAAYARKSKRQIHYDLDLLVNAKLIRPGDQSLVAHLPVNRRPVVYDLALERSGVQSASPQSGVKRASRVQSTSPLQSTSPQSADDLQEQAGVQSASPQAVNSRGATHFTVGVQPIADKPSIEPKPIDGPVVVKGGSGGEKTARRLPDDFAVTAEMVAWHQANTPHVDGRRETEKFIDHWRSASGANARKRDWVAAWRNWMRKADDDLARRGSGRPAARKLSIGDRALVEAEELKAQLRSQHRELP